jgi:hypothetical protein
MTRSQIFKQAHINAKQSEINKPYRQRFSFELFCIYGEIAEKKQKSNDFVCATNLNSIKAAIMRYAFDSAKHNYAFHQRLTNDACGLIVYVSSLNSFAANVASTCLASNKISEKQAYVIAREIVLNKVNIQSWINK